jgi:hypothetical protein
MALAKNRHEDQWNRIEDLDMNPHSYALLIVDKGTKKYTIEKRQPLQQVLLGKVVIYLQKTETGSMFIPCTNIYSKWIKDLNIRPEILTLVQERARNTLEVIGIGKNFLNRTSAAQQLRERMDELDFIKLKSF